MSEVNYCHRCGAHVQPGWSYCPLCGVVLAQVHVTPIIPMENPPMKPIGPYFGPVIS